ncbi:MAG: dTDP-glucose 4,6-dehydratase [Spirochaeta sp. LUC14_002_19_P3]|nr:MAG: dTDP-glucose 4,6-dehydratase [Spirochaeta sp. LUC14_002_19_P3]
MSISESTILVTGGAGFIGSSFIHSLFKNPAFTGRIVNIDLLTYAGNLASLASIADNEYYTFIRGDIRDAPAKLFAEFDIRAIVHFAAESHVDRSIVNPDDFITTNIVGTYKLLEAARTQWKDRKDVRFHHISTDEVFGSLGKEGYFTEESPYSPRSPYSASKASSDHLVRAYFHTYGLPITISNCSNNYGPRQFPEKLIPLMIENALEGKPLPVYGDGLNIRDWLHVDDHSAAVWKILTLGNPGETYAVGGNNEVSNIDLVRLVCRLLAEETGRPEENFSRLISFVKDRPGHDRRYAIDASKITRELGWQPSRTLTNGLRETIRWQLANRDWVDSVKSGEYLCWLNENYLRRGEN